jgi:hypothetical protein
MTDFRSRLEERFPLEGIGTRFEHYNELREVFADGIEVLTNMQAAHKTAGDEVKLNELKAAEKLITKRLEILSGFEQKTSYSSNLAVTCREIEIGRLKNKLLLKGKPDDAVDTTNSDSPEKDSNPTPDIP